MPQRQDYKNRTVQVRKNARAHLKELRNQRLTKRSQLVDAKPDLSIAEVGLKPAFEARDAVHSLEVSEVHTGAVLEVLEQFADSKEPESAFELPVDSLETCQEAGQRDHEMSATVPRGIVAEVKSRGLVDAQELDDRLLEKTAVSEMDDEVPVPKSEEKLTLVATEDQGQIALEPKVAQADPCDLSELPGSGPGLVWMLHQCGIYSLEELASADREQLTADLGVVGQILNVPSWIAFAKSK